MAEPAYLPDDPDPSVQDLIAARPHLRMDAQAGLLFDGVPLARIAQALGTPVWVYSADTMRARLAALKTALGGLDAHVHYAVKANDHLAVLKVFAEGGAGADVVSEGELRRARQAGIAAADIVFSGVGKTPAELRLAVAEGIAQVNIESPAELATLSAVASAMGKTMPVVLRINPDVDAGTHAKITTGRADNKFGFPYADAADLYAHATTLPGILPVGIALHIGSQILTLAPYRAAYRRAADLVRGMRERGLMVDSVDCGGGIGIGYRDDAGASPEGFAGVLRTTFGQMGVRLLIEPGRWLVGPAGLLLASVVLTKANGRFVVLDAAMNDLIRPAMYDAYHAIVPVSPVDALASVRTSDIVGPVCETADTFARARALPAVEAGALVAILDAGAYGAVMSSTYNARPAAPIAMIDAGRWTEIRPRQSHKDLWANEHVPDATTVWN